MFQTDPIDLANNGSALIKTHPAINKSKVCSLGGKNTSPTHSVEAQVPEQRLHKDLSQVGVRMARGSVVRRVEWCREAGSRGLHLGAVCWSTVAQQRGHVGVVLQAG